VIDSDREIGRLNGSDAITGPWAVATRTTGSKDYGAKRSNLEWLPDALCHWALATDGKPGKAALLRRATACHFRASTEIGRFAKWVRQLYKEILRRVRILKRPVEKETWRDARHDYEPHRISP